MGVNKIDYFGQTLIDLTGITATENDVAQGKTFVNAAGDILTGLLTGGAAASGAQVKTGTYTFGADMTGNSSTSSTTYYKQIDHGLGVVPDLVIFYAPSNIATTYSMLLAMRGVTTTWRSGYESLCAYHGNSTSTVTASNVSSSYGICAMTSTYFRVKTYSSSTSYYWRKGTYNWIAIKF